MRFLILTILCASLFAADGSPYGDRVERALVEYEQAVLKARSDLARDLERSLRHVPEGRQAEIETIILGASLGEDPTEILQEIHAGNLGEEQSRVGIRLYDEAYTIGVPYTTPNGGILGKFRTGDQISILHEPSMGASGFVTYQSGAEPGNPTYGNTVPVICAVNPRTGQIVPVQRLQRDMRHPAKFDWQVPQSAVYRLCFLDPDGNYAENTGTSYWRLVVARPD